MKKLIKIVLVKIIRTFISIFKIIVNMQKGRMLPSAEASEIYVLGNGPSVKLAIDKNANYFENKKVFCVNFIATAEFYDKLKPQYYALCDHIFFSDNTSPTVKKAKEEFLNDMIKKTKWDMYLFLPVQCKNSILFNFLKENPRITVVYLNINSFEGFNNIKYFSWQKNLATPILINVVIFALFLSINMGYKKIYLLGAESSWFKFFESSLENLNYIVDGHCYDDKVPEKSVMYIDKDSKVPAKMHEEMYAMFLCFKEYHEVQNYAKSLEVDIFNITPGSFIDAFTKIDLLEFMNAKSNDVGSVRY